MKAKISNIISVVLAVVLAAGVMTAFRACARKDDGTWMHCHQAQLYVLYISIAIAALALVTVFMKNQMVNIVLSAANGILAVAAVLIPGTIVKMCMMDTMRCHAVMKPFVIVMGILILIASVADVILGVRQRKMA